jgi:hypothetical protein
MQDCSGHGMGRAKADPIMSKNVNISADLDNNNAN